MNQATAISLYQPVLQSIAYKMVGSIQDAEDIVQDTFLKWLTIDQNRINNTKAYLIRSVTNNCINHLNSLKQKKKEYLDSVKLPEFFEKLDLSHLDIKHELAAAIALLQKKLGPLEKAVFVLREGFDFEYEELQEIFNKKKEYCRKLVSRAKSKLSVDTSSTKVTIGSEDQGLTNMISKAGSSGELDELKSHLAQSEKKSQIFS